MLVVETMIFREDQAHFSEDGVLSLSFHGLKNVYKRGGFMVSIPSSSDPKLDPASALCTKDVPVFLTLCGPYYVLSSKAVSIILKGQVMSKYR